MYKIIDHTYVGRDTSLAPDNRLQTLGIRLCINLHLSVSVSLRKFGIAVY